MNYRARAIGLIIPFLIVFLVSGLRAADRYWVGNGTSTDWNNTANWSSTSPGSGGATVPGSADIAIFNGNGLGTCSFNVSPNIAGINVNSTFTGTINKNAYSFTIGSSNAVFSGGTFNGGTSGTITVNGSLTISGGTFNSTGGTLIINGAYNLSNASFFNANNGTVSFRGSSTVNLSGNTNFNHLQFSPTTAATFVIASGTVFSVSGTLTWGGSAALTINTGSINLSGNMNIVNSSTGGGGTATINFMNTSLSQTLTGTDVGSPSICKISINKSSSTLNLSSVIYVGGGWNYASGIISPGSSTVIFRNSQTISGTHSLTNVTFSATVSASYTIASGTELTVTGSLNITGESINLNTGTINAKGSIFTSHASGNTGGTATIKINGTSTQVFTGSTTYGTAPLCNVIIEKGLSTLQLKDNIHPWNNWSYTSGTIDYWTFPNKVIFSENLLISGAAHTLGNVDFYARVAGRLNLSLEYYSTIEISTGTVLTVAGTLKTLRSLQVNLILDGGTINALGNIEITNTDPNSGGSATINITGPNNQTFTGSGIINTGKLCNISINKTGGILYLNSIISCAKDWTYVQGTVDASTNGASVAFCGTSTIDGEGSSSTMTFWDLNIHSGTSNLGGVLSVSGGLLGAGLSISSGATLSANNFQINLSGGWTNNGTFNPGTGTVNFDGGNDQSISTSSSSQSFYKLSINKSWTYSSVQLNSPVTVTNQLILSAGTILTTSTNLLTLDDDVSVVGGSITSNVQGPMRKIGNDSFTFPLGYNGGGMVFSPSFFRPLSITAPGNTTDAFVGEYLNSSLTTNADIADSLNSLSLCQYWKLTRANGTSNVSPGLGWNTSNCLTYAVNELTIANLSTSWIDIGNISTTTSGTSGFTTARRNAIFDNTGLATLLIAKKTCYTNAGPDVLTCFQTATQLNALGGQSYAWSPTTGLSSSTIANPLANPSTSTTYVVTGTIGQNSCNDNVIVTIHSLPIVNAGRDTTIEKGNSIILGGDPTISGGLSPYTYSWSPSFSLSSITSFNPTCSTEVSRSYVLSVQDARSCQQSDTINITVDPVKGFSIDFTQLGDTKYRVIAPGIDTVCSTHQVKKFDINNTSAVINIELNPLTGKSCFVQFEIDSLSAITNVKWKDYKGHIVSNFIALDSSYYSLEHYDTKLKLIPVNVTYKHEVGNEEISVLQFESSYTQNSNWKVFPGNYRIDVGAAPYKISELEINFNPQSKAFETNTAGWRDGDNSLTSDFIFFDHGFLENRGINEFAIKSKPFYFNSAGIDNKLIKGSNSFYDSTGHSPLSIFPGDHYFFVGDSSAAMKMEFNRSGEISDNILYSLGTEGLFELLDPRYFSIVNDTIYLLGDSLKVDITRLDNSYLNVHGLTDSVKIINNSISRYIKILPGSYYMGFDEDRAATATVRFLMKDKVISNLLWKEGNDTALFTQLDTKYYKIDSDSLTFMGKSISIDIEEAQDLNIFNQYLNKEMYGGRTYWLFPGAYQIQFAKPNSSVVKIIEVKQ